MAFSTIALNAAGSAMLGYVALKGGALGLILVEFAWALVSVFALARALRRYPGGPRASA